jgi:hypothetical protein
MAGYFYATEPFGRSGQTITGGSTEIAINDIADKYVFEELYDSTQTKARHFERINLYGRNVPGRFAGNSIECQEYTGQFGEGIIRGITLAEYIGHTR